jgi:hypothetical protein
MPPKAKKAPKDTSEPVNGKGDKGDKGNKSAAPAAAAAAAAPAKSPPAGAEAGQEEAEVKATTGTGKPDQAEYHAEQDRIKAEIDALQVKLVRHLPALHTRRGRISFTLSPSRRSRTKSL